MPSSDPQLLVSTGWLAEHLDAPDIRILDGSWHMPAADRDARAEYEASHIPGARFFDIDDISDDRSDLPHMVPPVEKFISRVRRLGVGDGHRIVVYDSAGIFSAARVWWMFRLFGHEDVAVLDGGLKKWLAEDRPADDAKPSIRDRHFSARRNDRLVRDVTQVAATAKLSNAQIIDARMPERFRGEVAEPRPGLRAGHIPGSKNVHYSTLLNDDGTMRPVEDLRAAFKAAGVDLKAPAITSCGSGVTAPILNLALERARNHKNAVYDGSWTEWGAYPDLEVETG